MHLSSILMVGLGLTSTASGYVVTLYIGANCSGNTQRQNVWDNTCASRKDLFLARSARVEVYGGWGQRARFHNDRGDNTCSLGSVFRGPWDAHQANNSWRVGNCIDFAGTTAVAFGSFAA